MRADLPEHIRRAVDIERRTLIRWVGARHEQLVIEGIDPAEWVASVLMTFPPANYSHSADESGYTSDRRSGLRDDPAAA